MFTLQINELKRNPKKINSLLKHTGESIIATDTLYILFPQRWEKLGFATLESKISILGNVLLSDEQGNSTVSMITTKFDTEPSSIDTHLFGDKEYYLFTYEKGSKVIANEKVIKEGVIFDIVNEYIVNGNVPEYFTYEDLTNVFLSARRYTGTNIVDDPQGILALVSIISRSDDNLKEYFREHLKGKPQYIGISKVNEVFNAAFPKIAGNYMKKGLRSAIVDENDETTELEEILNS